MKGIEIFWRVEKGIGGLFCKGENGDVGFGMGD